MDNYNVSFFGDCNVDVLIPIQELPVKGGCSFSSGATINMGGSSLNVTVASDLLGINCSYISKIGEDMFGSFLSSYLKDRGLNCKYLFSTSQYQTGLTVGLISPDGEKRWIAVRKDVADLHIQKEELKEISTPEAIYISGVAIVEGEESRKTAQYLAKEVSKKNGKVFLDPNIRVPTWNLSESIRGVFDDIYEYVDILIPNEKEIQMLGYSSTIKKSAQNILEKGVDEIWVKRGEEGCTYFTANMEKNFPTQKVKVVDTSGAGDAFDSAIIYSSMAGYNSDFCGRFGNLFAGYNVQRYGTTRALPGKTRIREMIAKIEEK
jgi:fructokinase